MMELIIKSEGSLMAFKAEWLSDTKNESTPCRITIVDGDEHKSIVIAKDAIKALANALKG